MAKADTGLANLRNQLKNHNIASLYLFIGEEEYLKKAYIDRLRAEIPDAGFPEFNHILLNGKLPLTEYGDAWESYPMMTDRRLMIIKDSKCMKLRTEKDDPESIEAVKEFWMDKLSHLNEDTVVVFDEVSVDKRSSVYKEIKKRGTVAEFPYLSPSELVTWIISECLGKKRKISKDNAFYLAQRVDPGLNNMVNELNKLYDYCDGEILKSDIDKVVSKSLTVINFDLTNAITDNDPQKAMRVLDDIKTLTKESSFAILYLLFSNIEKILRAKLMKLKNPGEAAKALGVSPFAAHNYIDTARRINEDALVKMACRVAEIDNDIKEGRTDEWTALYTFVTECLYYQRG